MTPKEKEALIEELVSSIENYAHAMISRYVYKDDYDTYREERSLRDAITKLVDKIPDKEEW